MEIREKGWRGVNHISYRLRNGGGITTNSTQVPKKKVVRQEPWLGGRTAHAHRDRDLLSSRNHDNRFVWPLARRTGILVGNFPSGLIRFRRYSQEVFFTTYFNFFFYILFFCCCRRNGWRTLSNLQMPCSQVILTLQ